MGLRIVLLGVPGAGKGTQGKRLSQAYGLAHVASGDILRKHIARGSEIGLAISEFMEDGHLVPDDLACAVVEERLAQSDCAQGYVLDGFPRSVPQARQWDQWLAQRGEHVDAAVNLDVPDDIVVARIVDRRTCPVCGAIYNLRFSPPPAPPNCGKAGCNGILERRDDDDETIIRERLRVYHETTKPIIDYYGQQGLLIRIPSDGLGPDAVYRKIEDKLNALESA